MKGEIKTMINLRDSVKDIVLKMGAGNPGGLRVMMDIITLGPEIDPDDFAKGLGTILWMDSLGIRGSKIWMLYKDVCGEDIIKTIGMMRAVQLGVISSETLLHAIDNYGDGVDVEKCLTKVKMELPNFGKNRT